MHRHIEAALCGFVLFVTWILTHFLSIIQNLFLSGKLGMGACARKHGYPYRVKANNPRGIFTKRFYGSAANVDRQCIYWQNEMHKQYRTFCVLNITDRPIPRGFFQEDYELTVTYRI